MNWRAVIVDDERLARKELRTLLVEHPTIEIVGEADSVKTAAPLIHSVQPDVIFLDIQMPGASGFQLLEAIDAASKVIFVTAFDAYAIRAFDVNALDYLLKPINPTRLAAAIARLTNSDAAPAAALRKLEYGDRLFLEINGRAQFLKLDQIVCLRAAGDYSEVIATDGKPAGAKIAEGMGRTFARQSFRAHSSFDDHQSGICRTHRRPFQSFLSNPTAPPACPLARQPPLRRTIEAEVWLKRLHSATRLCDPARNHSAESFRSRCDALKQ
jgi:two-component system LytT family response regulator